VNSDRSALETHLGPGASLFALSFLSLFLEIMFIRWVASEVRLVAYYANLILISSFLGLGLGAILAFRGFRLFRWFPIVLGADLVLTLLLSERALPGSTNEFRFFAGSATLANYLVLVTVFVLNAAVFVPLGERVGQLFHQLPTLRAYNWDLGGSLCGTIGFGLFSFYAFSPFVGIFAVILLYAVVAEPRYRLSGVLVLVLALSFLGLSSESGAIWSPYHYITVHEGWEVSSPRVTEPAPNLRTMRDPPIYSVRVNRDFYQAHGTIDPSRYSPGSDRGEFAERKRVDYMLVYELVPRPRKVAVVGAGGGVDVEAALLSSASSVEAVEIDPALVELSRRFNASGVYDDPRVSIRIDDARAFFRRTDETYDAIVFGYLDSQALSSSMAGIRLDGFVYTVESFRSAFRRLNEEGVLAVSFVVGKREWLAGRLVGMMREATGEEPIVYRSDISVSVLGFRGGPRVRPPETFGPLNRARIERSQVPLATDDWPQLYLQEKSIPTDYVVVITVLMLISLSAVVLLRPEGMDVAGDGVFLFLGMGFLLLQTKSIVDCSLYFGATWFVTMIVVSGVLLMVMLANLAALRLKGFRAYYYVPLLASLVALHVVPREVILSLSFAGRLFWTLLAVPLPVFFAGLVFSTKFRESARPSASFGVNLIGATIGGFSEYLGMATGARYLSFVLIGAYLLSFLCLRVFSRRNVPQGAGLLGSRS
jgi:Spermine/spermidine synthase domain